MKQILIKAGRASVADIPAPDVSSGHVLVRVEHSCISAGTELAGLRMSALPLYQRALQQPENVKRVLAMAREQGLVRTIDRVRGKLAAGNATGYSASGVIVAVGANVDAYSIGDRVACAGAGIANHAELINVPINLAARVPDNLSTDLASTVTLGAIALQGVRRASPTLGETFVVIGLGILGQLTAQILRANGCRVIGVDVDPLRISKASENGLDIGIDPNVDDYVDRVTRITGGLGADAVIITAASSESSIISQAMQATRKKGRVVLVGDVGLNLNRADFYQKELDLFISTSYGPGRYDPTYEEAGHDYPLPYVRWTENRNMQAYLNLLASGTVNLSNLLAPPFEIDRAEEAYGSIRGEGPRPLIVLLSYPPNVVAAHRRVPQPVTQSHRSSSIRVGLIGASSFAQSVHLPNIQKLKKRFSLEAVMSRTGVNATALAQQYGARYSTTSLDDILSDSGIDLVFITSRHNLHGSTVLKALHAGKHVFVEKPLTLRPSDLDELESFYSANPRPPILFVGYNRRFSPPIHRCLEVLSRRSTPIIVNYRVNAGALPADHWVQGDEGGGRNLGEACHIYDLFNALVADAEVSSVHAAAIKPTYGHGKHNENFIATVAYDDGSVCSLTYTSLGAKDYPKERMELFSDGRVVSLDDYKSLTIAGGRHKAWTSNSPRKGHYEELIALGDSIIHGSHWPIDLNSLIRTSRISFAVEAQLTSNY
jgi:predicted dehydrogenase/threonine dehydrogenase-like Zn-dependent dehydrogenase